MVKSIFTLSVMTLLLVGCGKEVSIITETQDRYVNVLYCPAPPEISRPELPIQHMTTEQEASDGEVAKHYKATVKTLIGYSKELEKVIDNQKKINKAYIDKKKELESTSK